MSNTANIDAPEVQYVSVKSGAKVLDVSESTFVRLTRNHPDKFPKFRFGRAVRYRLSDVEAFAASQVEP